LLVFENYIVTVLVHIIECLHTRFSNETKRRNEVSGIKRIFWYEKHKISKLKRKNLISGGLCKEIISLTPCKRASRYEPSLLRSIQCSCTSKKYK
jgi:hypothetical protein